MKFLMRKEIIVPLMGFCFCLIVSALPEMVPKLVEKEGYVWSPVNSARFRAVDTFQYAAWMMEIVRGHIPPEAPGVAEKSDSFSVEIFKLTSMMLAAAPSMVFSDPRDIIAASRCLFPAVLFLALLFSCKHLYKKCLVLGAARPLYDLLLQCSDNFCLLRFNN